MLYKIYYCVTYILHLLLPVLLKRRLKLGKEDTSRYQEKLGYYSTKRPKGDLIWFHAVSVGEFNSIVELLKRMSADNNILLTTVTRNSQRVVDKAGLHNVIHQYAPFDTPQVVERFLQYWKPTKAVFIDSELWPNLIIKSAKVCKLYNINARLSDRSFSRWSKLPALATLMYSSFYKIAAASEHDMKKITTFVVQDRVVSFGNLKFSLPMLKVDKAALLAYQKMCADRFIIVAASTHPREEEMLIDALKDRLNSDPQALLIVVPRDVSRGQEIKHIAQSYGFKAALRSETAEVCGDINIYIADTLGELGLWYRLSTIVFVGGSLVDIGGHNVIEPAKLSNSIITGPYYHNFSEVVGIFKKGDAILVVNNVNELREALEDLMMHKKKLDILIKRAFSLSNTTSIVPKISEMILLD